MFCMCTVAILHSHLCLLTSCCKVSQQSLSKLVHPGPVAAPSQCTSSAHFHTRNTYKKSTQTPPRKVPSRDSNPRPCWVGANHFTTVLPLIKCKWSFRFSPAFSLRCWSFSIRGLFMSSPTGFWRDKWFLSRFQFGRCLVGCCWQSHH